MSEVQSMNMKRWISADNGENLVKLDSITEFYIRAHSNGTYSVEALIASPDACSQPLAFYDSRETAKADMARLMQWLAMTEPDICYCDPEEYDAYEEETEESDADDAVREYCLFVI